MQTFHNNDRKTTKKGLMLEVVHPDFPWNNLFRRTTTKESIMLQPMHFLLTKYSFYRMGLATIFMAVLTQLFYLLEMLKLSPQNIISKNKNFVKEN
jgi:hypothetical protein